MKVKRGWREAWSIYRHPRVAVMLFLGFSAGLPFLLVFSTLSAWLRDNETSLTVIGFFSWVGITYSIKVIWAPVVDRWALPLLGGWFGKRRSWMLVSQLGIALGLAGMSFCDPQTNLSWIAYFAVFVAFNSATQDIVIDAYRIEAVIVEFQGAMAAAYVLGYRVALLVAGAGSFYIAEIADWEMAYLAMSVLMVVGIITVLVIDEPSHREDVSVNISNRVNNSIKQRFFHLADTAIIQPFVDFFSRNGKQSLVILSLIGVYKISDITMGVMANPFYLDLGFSKIQIAEVTKIFGFFMTIVGTAFGGVMVVRYGVMLPLVLGSILIAVTNLLFAGLTVVEPNLSLLALVISADNLSAGIATAAFIAYLSSLVNTVYTATQYALFSSLMTLPAKLLGGYSGVVVDHYGYSLFFIYSASLGLPAIILSTILIANSGLDDGKSGKKTG